MSQLTQNTTDLDALIAKANALPDAGTSEDLTAVLDAQETLISELEAELEGKAAGGGAPQLVQISFICTTNDPYSVVYTSYENGANVIRGFDVALHDGETISMCCTVGSCIHITDSNGEGRIPVVSDNITCTLVDASGANSDFFETDGVFGWTPRYWLTIDSGTTGTITM